jgi:hypothetical protein
MPLGSKSSEVLRLYIFYALYKIFSRRETTLIFKPLKRIKVCPSGTLVEEGIVFKVKIRKAG